MTPDKGKKPLPSSTSFMFPERPTTYQQWKIALQRVKISYLRGQWKECATLCSQLLFKSSTAPFSIHATYLLFYSALSSEAIARMSHPLSSTKLHVLEQAKASYEAAASSLPITERLSDPDGPLEDDTRSDHSFTTSTRTGPLENDQSSSVTSGSHDEPSSPSSIESENFSQDIVALKPSPLRIRKSSLPTLGSTVSNPDNQLFFRAFSRPPQSPSTPPRSRPVSFTLAPSDSLWLQVCARERYNAHLIAFKQMLSNHLSTVATLIETTKQAQAMRYFAKRLASYGEDEAAKEADLQARMVRLKAAGWRRERFRPERYQVLCERALEEL